MNKLPLARNTNIVVQELGKEFLIYDLNTHKAYNLNETSTIVYKACDGNTSFDELRVKNNFTDDIIFLALDELKKESLLEENQAYNSPFSGMSRREVIRKVGFASMIALPVISSLVAPAAAMAQSCRAVGQSCSPPNSLGNCCNGTAYCGSRVCQACRAPSNLGCTITAAVCATLGYVCCSGITTSTPDPAGCGIGVRCVCT
jgi:hypothetical protein